MPEEPPPLPPPVIAAAPDATALLDPAAVLSAVGDPVRHALLRELADGATLAVNDLAGRVRRAPDATAKHLRVLREARLVLAAAPPDGDGRKQFSQVPALFRSRDAAGRRVLDFGTVVLRFD